MIVIKEKIQFTKAPTGHRRISTGPVAPEPPPGRVPRISKLMALAIRFDGLIRDGLIADQSELARLAKVSQPRMTQIMNLLHLAPDIQEELLFLTRVLDGRDPIHERMLRPVAAKIDWQRQRALWRKLLKEQGFSSP